MPRAPGGVALEGKGERLRDGGENQLGFFRQAQKGDAEQEPARPVGRKIERRRHVGPRVQRGDGERGAVE